MKEIHNADFNFVPMNCVASLRDTLAVPVPAHLLGRPAEGEDVETPGAAPAPAPAPLLGDLAKLPPPVSHLLGKDPGRQLTNKGKSILHAIQAPGVSERPRRLYGREAILRALTDDAYA